MEIKHSLLLDFDCCDLKSLLIQTLKKAGWWLIVAMADTILKID